MNNANWAIECELLTHEMVRLLHNVKVQCGIESHDWALASSHVAACRLMSFSTANAVEGETARTYLRSRIGEQAHQGCSIGKQGWSIATTI